MELNNEMTYAEAASRLQALLDEMEHGDPDMDRMTAMLEESSALAAFCLERISSMEQILEAEKKKLPE
jgi:exodeoxyribonuclease VII small subunit